MDQVDTMKSYWKFLGAFIFVFLISQLTLLYSPILHEKYCIFKSIPLRYKIRYKMSLNRVMRIQLAKAIWKVNVDVDNSRNLKWFDKLQVEI